MKPIKICSIDGCGKQSEARGWCHTHYCRWSRTGSVALKTKAPSDLICSIDGCNKGGKLSRTWCAMHYSRWRSYGDPNKVSCIVGDDSKRFWSKIEKTSTCWNWTPPISKAGYGHISINGSLQYAHRVSWEMCVGKIPKGIDIDHRCHNTRCVNPSHLRLATRKQNIENHSGLNRNNTSGVRGVSWHKGAKKWSAAVWHGGSKHFVGLFVSIEEAKVAVIAKRNELHTHNDLDRIPA